MKIFGIAGYKNSGKTGLTERLVAEFTARGLRVSTVKHTHHRVDLDKPGKDSHRHREAGAQEVLIVSENRWALLHELREDPEPPLEALLPKLSPVDLVLVEGYKSGPHPRIEAHRAETGKPFLADQDPTILAIASDTPSACPEGWVVFHLDDTGAIADFISATLGL
ncbi:molybdopterin guanine dinucleotide biosynthesis accessory protein MobB [Pseudooceanicola nitratireducens]|jgi:molybdopterin-guanine dinucleotide biosynthesis protein MobB|uniref:Molybdopterin guanine dinucleotide biosynthesis accessory protein MobB n=1 Tax=Pseudooceanicola nitratireducens TaxID=517719 RepID=A0A1I1II85_9RHOB|nr:molybdopterin-guanine dinucleotide biosynthesis protein B [Pseudooceanicola nitratireducens]SEJ23615.1 molybdopterin molybdotransferase/molybdopterin-guanine dinucleotide biosynthesis protein B [Pseudooceanicola nitratireducens]SFC35976.1 molybdopterin guanine dinucleotide biosynthesis accessory protein MobB [Pseudooceanicola nitratireducens]